MVKSDKPKLKIEKFMRKTKKELDRFFGFTISGYSITLLNSRKEINQTIGWKTPSWFVAWCPDNKIYILRQDKFETESSWNAQWFWRHLKHEIAHIYMRKRMNGTTHPLWLTEGMCGLLANQKKENTFEDAVKATRRFSRYDHNVYDAARIVRSLFQKYGKKKMVALLKTCGPKVTKEQFAKNFKKIYGFGLTEKELKHRLI